MQSGREINKARSYVLTVVLPRRRPKERRCSSRDAELLFSMFVLTASLNEKHPAEINLNINVGGKKNCNSSIVRWRTDDIILNKCVCKAMIIFNHPINK